MLTRETSLFLLNSWRSGWGKWKYYALGRIIFSKSSAMLISLIITEALVFDKVEAAEIKEI